ncbi:heparinase II/III family protein [Paenibacillus sp. S150]|nr:heparinase II/III family protein [Paenibacillus sp. S150]
MKEPTTPAALADIVQGMPKAGLELYGAGGDTQAFWRGVKENAALHGGLEEIRSEAERLLDLPVPELSYSLFSLYRTQGTRLEYERVYFERRRRLNAFALMVLLEPESKRYEAALHEMIWAICGEQTWCLPAHVNDGYSLEGSIDLFSAETGFTLAELSVLLGCRLPEFLRVLISDCVDARIFQPYLVGGPFFWETIDNNWAAVCAGSAGAAALLLLEDKARLTNLLGKVQRTLSFYFKGIGDDGGCLEGLGYWNYGFGYFTYYADLLKSMSGGALDWFREPKVKKTAAFQQKSFLGKDAVVNFSDTVARSGVQLGLSCYLAELYPGEVALPPFRRRADFRGDHCSRWAPAFRNLIWNGAAAATDWKAGSFYLPDAQWIISRVEQGETVFGFAAKGGHNGEPHNHNDLGQFLLARNGRFYLADLGSGEYTREYFGPERYSFDCNGSQGHSVPVIDGVQQSAGRTAAAKVLEAETGGEEDQLSLDLTSAYDCGRLLAFKRRYRWLKGCGLPRLRLEDEFAFASVPGSVTERFVTLIQPAAGEGEVLIAAADGTGVKILYDSAALRPEIKPRRYRNHAGAWTEWFALDFHLLAPGENVCAFFDFIFTG